MNAEDVVDELKGLHTQHHERIIQIMEQHSEQDR